MKNILYDLGLLSSSIKKTGALIILLFISIVTIGQSIYGVNLDSMELILNQNPDFYTEIVHRFSKNDSQLKPFDLAILYYGSAFQKEYNPYNEGITSLTSQSYYEKGAYIESIKFSSSLIKNDPANLSAYVNLALAQNKIGDTNGFRLNMDKYSHLLSIPLYSGNGRSPESAFVVTSVEHENIILSELGCQNQKKILVHHNKRPFHKIHVVNMKTNAETDLYFNIKLPLSRGKENMYNYQPPENRVNLKKKILNLFKRQN